MHSMYLAYGSSFSAKLTDQAGSNPRLLTIWRGMGPTLTNFTDP